MSALTDLLLQGPQTAAQLRAGLNVSQATFSRLVAAEPQVVQFGKARATRYALQRPVRGVSLFPLRCINEQGRVQMFGHLIPCWPRGSCLVEREEGGWQWFDGLPWYLTDLRPQGFLGRAWGRSIAGQYDLPEDIRLWQEDDVLFALSLFAGEHAGGWLVGDASYQRWVYGQPPGRINEKDKISRYTVLAQHALAGEVIGSSAGGEQPKFTCFAQTETGNMPVLVKFTAPQVTPASQRWGDLLIAEAIALDVLSHSGINASDVAVLIGEHRQVFLQSIRFDCIGAEGRRAIVSLEALQSEFASTPGAWPKVVGALARQHLVEENTLRLTERIWAYGRLIANSDMHAGNLSFYFSSPPLKLTPVYDMLPMAFAPASSGAMREEAVDLVIDPQVGSDVWDFAIPLAETFWRRVAEDELISNSFRQIALGMGSKLEQVKRLVRRLA